MVHPGGVLPSYTLADYPAVTATRTEDLLLSVVEVNFNLCNYKIMGKKLKLFAKDKGLTRRQGYVSQRFCQNTDHECGSFMGENFRHGLVKKAHAGRRFPT